jgi:N-acetylmuramoyl-L-alanine amidase-like protein
MAVLGPGLFELDLAEEAGRARAAAAGDWRVTRVLRAPRRFDLIGLRWAGDGALEAQVRARRRGGDWTEWLPLPSAADHGPDDDRSRVGGTDPAWTGTADQFQLRFRGHAPGLRARFVRARPTAGAARRLGARLSRRKQVTAPPIITRAEWGGDAVTPRDAPSFGEVQLALVHHTVSANDYGPGDSAAIVLGIARFHRDSNKWNDLGYNFLVDKYGQIFEGRAGGVEQAVIGAHAQGYNASSTGVACIGTFEAVAQTEAGMNALARLIGWKLALHGIPVEGAVTVTSAGGSTNRFPRGAPVTLSRICGHRDGDKTSCPGDALHGQLADLRTRAARYTGTVSIVNLRAAASKVRAQRSTRLSGSLRFGDGSSPSGAAVEIQFQARRGAWQRLAGAVTNMDGSWSANVVVPETGRLRAAFPGDANRPPLQSKAVTITVLPLLTLALNTRRVRERRRVAVSGEMAPRPAGGRVTCILERRLRGRWVRIQRKRINVRGGRYATPVRLPRAGLYRITVTAPGATKRTYVRAVDVTGGMSAPA